MFLLESIKLFYLPILFIIILLWFIYIYYKTHKSQNKYSRYLLVILRTVSILLIIFILIEPIFLIKKAIFKNKSIAFVIDNSKSMSISLDTFNLNENFKNYFSTLNKKNINYSYFIFGDSLREIKTLSNQIESISIDKIDLLKIDCEGNELNVIDGINSTHWSIIKQLVIEVNDIDGRLDYIKKKLTDLGYKYKIIKEDALKNTNLVNIFAKK